MAQGVTIKGKTPNGQNVEILVDGEGRLLVSNSELSQASRYDYSDSSLIYEATAPIGSPDAAEVWTITRYDLSDPSEVQALVALNTAWDNRAGAIYG